MKYLYKTASFLPPVFTGFEKKLDNRVTGYSAHADQNILVKWVNSMPRTPEEIRLVHGEEKARKALAKKLNIEGS